jgi:ubiquinone/menaquinone biosynthesis C-methylase UbiE
MNWYKGKVALAKAISLDLTYPQIVYARALRHYVHAGTKWLDIGCGREILPFWAMSQQEQEQLARVAGLVIGVDADENIAEHSLPIQRVTAVGGALPFRNETFDLVTAHMVVEDIDEPQDFLADIFRILHPDGHFLFHTPNLLFWLTFLAHLTPQAMKQSLVSAIERHHRRVLPAYYRMNTPWRVARMARQSGFQVEELQMAGSSHLFDHLGPLGWVECFVQKTLATLAKGRLNSNIIAVLRRGQKVSTET